MSTTPKPRTVRLLDREPPAISKTPPAGARPSIPAAMMPPTSTAAPRIPRMVGKFIIESCVPVPKRHTTVTGLLNTLPFQELEVGESFVIADFNHKNGYQLCQRMQKAAPGRKFISRKVDNGVRIWRTA